MTDFIVPYLGEYQLKLNTEFAIDNHFLQKGSWENHLTTYIQYFVRPGSVCIDVGANVGFHTIAMAASCGQQGRVYAFEPDTRSFPRLIDNINLNPSLKPQIVPEKLGVSNKKGNLKLFASGELSGNAYMAEEQNENYWNSGGPEDFELCIVTPLDEYLHEGEKVDFMKIDVEGMELEVLQGARKTIMSHKPIIVYETLLSCFDREKIKACERLLQDLGYSFFFIHPEIQKLLPVRAPLLTEDTLAIHSSQIPKFGEIMYNAAHYKIQLPKPGTKEQDLVVVGLDRDLFVAEVRHNDSGEANLYEGRCEGGVLSLQAKSGKSRLNIELFRKDPSVAAPNGVGRIIDDLEESTIMAELKGGKLLNCTFFSTEEQ